MQQIDTIILARWLLPIAPENIVLEHQAIAIQGKKIVNILPAQSYLEHYQAKQVINCNEHAVLPGFVNAHTHTPMNLFRGLADDLELMDWLNHYIWPAEQAIIQADSVRDGCRFAIAEMIRSGTTCFNDSYFYHEILAQTANAEGIRAMLGLGIIDVPTQYAQNENDYLEKAQLTLEKSKPSDLINWSIAPHAPYTVSDTAFKKIAALADEKKLRIHLHLNETIAEIEMSMERYHKRPIERLYELGMVNSNLMAVHMVYANDDEIALLKAQHANIILCPKSNMKLASGIAPLEKYLAAAINIGLGTDGAASNNNLDMLNELRSMNLLTKVNNKNPTLLSAQQTLEIATLGGAKVLGLEDKIGSLEIGKEADIIAINLNSVFTQPVYHPMSTLVYAANASQVSDVWIAGKRLLADGEFTQLDIKQTMKNVAKWADKTKLAMSKSK